MEGMEIMERGKFGDFMAFMLFMVRFVPSSMILHELHGGFPGVNDGTARDRFRRASRR